MEQLKTTPELYFKKIKFIEEAMGENAHQKIPKNMINRKCHRKYWKRTVDIGLLYNLGPETTGQSVGDIYNLSRERIGKLNKKFLLNLYENSSSEIKKKYSLETILFKKPLPQVLREKQSEREGGIGLKVRNAVQRGITDPKQISLESGFSLKELKIAKSSLKKIWNIDLHIERKRRSYKEIAEIVKKETNDNKLQELLDSFSNASLLGLIYNRGNQSQTSFTLLGKTLQRMGINPKRSKSIANALKSIGIPVRQLDAGSQIISGRKYSKTYCIIYQKHKQRIIDAIKTIGIENKKESKDLAKTNIELF